MQSAVAMAFAYLIDADIPKNDGAFRALHLAIQLADALAAAHARRHAQHDGAAWVADAPTRGVE